MSSSLLCNIWHFISLWTSHSKLIENCSNTQIVEDCFWRCRLVPKLITRWLSDKEFACQCRGCSSVPGSGRSPRRGNGNLLQYSCLGNPTDRGAWWATVHWLQRVGHDWTCTHTTRNRTKTQTQKGFFSHLSQQLFL